MKHQLLLEEPKKVKPSKAQQIVNEGQEKLKKAKNLTPLQFRELIASGKRLKIRHVKRYRGNYYSWQVELKDGSVIFVRSLLLLQAVFKTEEHEEYVGCGNYKSTYTGKVKAEQAYEGAAELPENAEKVFFNRELGGFYNNVIKDNINSADYVVLGADGSCYAVNKEKA